MGQFGEMAILSVTSLPGMFGDMVAGEIGMGYVNNESGVIRHWIESGSYDIDIAGERFAARASLTALYDPKRERILT